MPNQIKIDINSAESLIAAMTLASKDVNSAVDRLKATDDLAELLKRIQNIKSLNFEDYTLKFQNEIEKTLKKVDFKGVTEGLFDTTKNELIKANGQSHKIAESLSKTHDLLAVKVLDLSHIIDNYKEIDILLEKTAQLSKNVASYKKSYGFINMFVAFVAGACLTWTYLMMNPILPPKTQVPQEQQIEVKKEIEKEVKKQDDLVERKFAAGTIYYDLKEQKEKELDKDYTIDVKIRESDGAYIYKSRFVFN